MLGRLMPKNGARAARFTRFQRNTGSLCVWCRASPFLLCCFVAARVTAVAPAEVSSFMHYVFQLMIASTVPLKKTSNSPAAFVLFTRACHKLHGDTLRPLASLVCPCTCYVHHSGSDCGSALASVLARLVLSTSMLTRALVFGFHFHSLFRLCAGRYRLHSVIVVHTIWCWSTWRRLCIVWRSRSTSRRWHP